jgi:hypothetical protein
MPLLPTAILMKKCRRVGLFSLGLGTAMLGLFFFSSDLIVAFMCAPVVLVLGVYNLKVLLQLLWRAQLEPAHRKALWRTGVLLSLNLPVALLYTKLVLVLSNTLVVRLVNDTPNPLRHLVILGCGEPRPLADLSPGQSTIVWLPISRACSCFERTVSAQYSVGTVTQQTMIDGYVVEGKRLNVQLGRGPALAAARG